MENNLIKKIEMIFYLFDNICEISDFKKDAKKKVKKNSKIWNIDTSIFSIINNFFLKIKELVNEDVLEKDSFLFLKKIDKNSERFSIFFLDKNVTPSLKEHVAYSTMWQYLRILNYFDLIIIPTKTKKALYEINKISWSINIYSFLREYKINKFFTLENLGYFISQGIKNDIYGYKDISYSIFLLIIYKLDINRLIINDKSIINFFHFASFKSNKKINNVLSNDLHFSEKLDKIWNETYKELILKFFDNINEKFKDKNEYFLLKKIIDEILNNLDLNWSNRYSYDDSFNKIFEYKSNLVGEINLEREISNARSKLRENILSSRNNNDDIYYSDIEPIDDNIDFVHDCIDQQEAAHIISVSSIKKIIKNNRDYFYLLSDPNNGLLMDHIYHDAFDRGWLRFNVKGEMIATYKWKEKYFDNKNNKYIKYPLMKIKKNVFSSEMKNNFIKKNELE